MPPKKGGDQPKKAKPSAADKTFGMKNKKGSVAQKQIAAMQAQDKSNQKPDEKRKQAEKEQREREKAASEAAKREAAELFKPVQTQKVPFGVDPKTVLCQFYKQGHCEKGRKCKFSHDLQIGRRQEKKDLYQDTREQEKQEREKDTMDDWDEDKLRKVVLSKHGNPKTTTEKVCKFFIEAVENGKYGWFWTCPNGGDKCMYQHKLPPGFVLKTKEQRAAEKALMDKSPLKTLTLEDFLESERHKLTGELTPVTPETFAKWKKERLDKKAAEDEARKAKEATGRAMFESGNWKDSEDEDSDDDGEGVWNLEAMRNETEKLREAKEQERLAKANGGSLPENLSNGALDDDEVVEDDYQDIDGNKLGLGYPMARNLRASLPKDDKLFIYDTNHAATDNYTKEDKEESFGSVKGPQTSICSGPREVAELSGTIITVLPEPKHVKSVFDEILTSGLPQPSDPQMPPERMFIDCSTIDPITSQDVAASVRAGSCGHFVDAPMSGGVVGARAASLTFMVGAAAHIFERVEAILLRMGKKVWHLGDQGAGLSGKLANNYALAINNIGAAEAMNLGIKWGLEPKALANLINSSTGRSWPSQINSPVPGVVDSAPSSNNYEGGFGVSLMKKDLRLAMTAAKEAGARLELAEKADEVYDATTRQFPGKDFSVVYKYIKDVN
ncbi:MAG: hypothetical protein Q9227_005848 [Pyrenula ochraceoflavens]